MCAGPALGDESLHPQRQFQLEALIGSIELIPQQPVVGTLLRRELGIRAAAASGDTVTPVLLGRDPGVGFGSTLDRRVRAVPRRRHSIR
jgi:hypothetical protein